MYRYNQENFGEFYECDYGKNFTYRETKNEWALSHGLKYEIDLTDGTRFARIRKTVADICINEDASGNPVIEKWFIKKHVVFPK
jgi:hypothetical protein